MITVVHSYYQQSLFVSSLGACKKHWECAFTGPSTQNNDERKRSKKCWVMILVNDSSVGGWFGSSALLSHIHKRPPARPPRRGESYGNVDDHSFIEKPSFANT